MSQFHILLKDRATYCQTGESHRIVHALWVITDNSEVEGLKRKLSLLIITNNSLE